MTGTSASGSRSRSSRSPGSRDGWFWAFALSLFLSGVAALIYQVVWVRQLSLVMGSTLEAVSIVLATFMAGLGLGSAVAARRVDAISIDRQPRVYAALELGIGGFGLVFPLLLAGTTPLFQELYRSSSGVTVAFGRVVTAVILLLPPTTLMGATLPLVTSLAMKRGAPNVGAAAGRLYAANTFGAMVGSLGCGLLLLYWLGLSGSAWLAVLLNGAAAGTMLLVASRFPSTEAPSVRETSVETEGGGAARLGLAVIFLSGLAALVSEVAWTRSLVLLLGPTVYGFSFIVSAVIGGLALGSSIGARLAVTAFPARRLAAVQLGAGTAGLVLIQIIGRLALPIGSLVRNHADDVVELLGLELLWVFVLLLVPSLLLGASFPLAVRLVSGPSGPSGSSGAGRFTGRTYLWNTVGAVIGSFVSGFVLLPRWGAEATLSLAAAVHFLAVVLLLWRGEISASGRAISFARVSAIALVLVGVLAPRLLPRWDREILSGGIYKYAPYLQPEEFLDFLRRGELLYYREGKAATISVKGIGPRISLAVDGKVDATNSNDMLTQRMLAHVPLLLHPDPRQVLVVGFGSGVTAGSALTHPVDRVEAVEISEEVVEAARFFSDENHRAWENERLSLRLSDGRNHLLLSEERYDVIISEPSNPWMAGVSALFTRDFFSMAGERLKAGGLFCQWAHIYNMATDDLKILVASFTDGFENTALFVLNQGDILLVGAKDGFAPPSPDVLEARMQRKEVKNDMSEVGVTSPTILRMLYTTSTPALARWAAEAPRNTDDRPLLEFHAPRFMHADTGRTNREALERLRDDGSSLGLEPSRPTAEDLLAWAGVLEKAESFEWSYQVLTEALRLDPNLGGAHRALVRLALALEQPRLAEEPLKELAAGPAPVEARIGLALLYRNLGELDSAVAILADALRREPERREALFMAAEIEGDRGELDSMRQLALRILRNDPLDAEAAALLAEVSLRRGALEVARERALAILAKRPQEPRALQVLAIANAQMGRTAEAATAFEELVRLEPEAFVHLNNYGRLQLEAGRFEEAARLFERAVDLNPRNLPGYEGLQEAAEALGDVARSERALSMIAFLHRGIS